MASTYNDLQKRKKEYEAAAASKPGAFKSEYSDIRNQMLDKIAAREDFSYDPATDAVYNIYKEGYRKAGEKASRDTVASAAALTGGFASSYGARAAADAYNDYLTRSGEILPDLYELALKRYERNAANDDELLSIYNSLISEEESSYNDLWDRYYKDLEAANNAYKAAETSYNNERNYYYKVSSGGSSSGSNKALTDDTEATRAFTASLLGKYNYSHSPLRTYYSSYTDYIRKTAYSWYYDGKLSDRELTYLKNQYNF